MSRSGYHHDGDNWDMIRWRGAVNSAVKGKRGQAMLRELLSALDAMPEKRLVSDELVTPDGDYCALGALGHARGLDMTHIDPDDRVQVAKAFGVAESLAAEIMDWNDRGTSNQTYVDVEVVGPLRYFDCRIRSYRVPDTKADERRWCSMRSFVESLIEPEASKP